jgi:hypothetical protein
MAQSMGLGSKTCASKQHNQWSYRCTPETLAYTFVPTHASMSHGIDTCDRTEGYAIYRTNSLSGQGHIKHLHGNMLGGMGLGPKPNSTHHYNNEKLYVIFSHGITRTKFGWAGYPNPSKSLAR